jgi:HSP20 family protein
MRHNHQAHWSPLSLLGRAVDEIIQQGLTDLVGHDMPTGHQPAANITETDKAWLLEVAAPGFNKTDFSITTENRQIIVSAKKEEVGEKGKDKFLRREFRFNEFKRRFTLPEHVLIDEIKASYDNGILAVELPKKEAMPKAEGKAIVVH